ncbi:unnamed protein product [Rotaria sp. Silwood2]|nr:unnamed protein product [Rotaria sp. Silwood2]CAF2857112.1 unnamed protein product [Rotaria sp. Silwood2]CAF4200306.1 unnamed protein product [Rotaria sp. Silwood2]
MIVKIQQHPPPKPPPLQQAPPPPKLALLQQIPPPPKFAFPQQLILPRLPMSEEPISKLGASSTFGGSNPFDRNVVIPIVHSVTNSQKSAIV